MYIRPLLVGLAATSFATSAAADQIFADDLIVEGNICVGSDQCVDMESFGDTDLRLKGFVPEIQFFDTSNSGDTWNITVDDPDLSIDNALSFQHQDSDTFPFVVSPTAQTNSLFVDDLNRIGIGTNLPQANLHVVNPTGTTIRLETPSSFGGMDWQIDATVDYFSIGWRPEDDMGSFERPFLIDPGAPRNTLNLSSTGNVGIGTGSPQAPLEVRNDASFSFFRITASDADVNQSVDITFTEGPLGTCQSQSKNGPDRGVKMGHCV